MQEQMNLTFAEKALGFADDGVNRDPVSGNEIIKFTRS